jgi:hypothetical protein
MTMLVFQLVMNCGPTRLLAMMDELGLYRDERKTADTALLVKRMQERIETKVIPEKESFTLSFVHEDPQHCRLVRLLLSRASSVSKAIIFFRWEAAAVQSRNPVRLRRRVARLRRPGRQDARSAPLRP